MAGRDRVEQSLFPSQAAASSPAATRPVPEAAASTAPAPGLSPATAEQLTGAVHWLRWGRGRGLASEALLFAALAGTPPRADDWHGSTVPNCRADLYRCLRLCADLPWARRGVDVLAAAYPAWAALRHDWDALTAAMAAEIGPTWPLVDLSSGRWPDTTRTEALLRKALQRGGVAI